MFWGHGQKFCACDSSSTSLLQILDTPLYNYEFGPRNYMIRGQAPVIASSQSLPNSYRLWHQQNAVSQWHDPPPQDSYTYNIYSKHTKLMPVDRTTINMWIGLFRLEASSMNMNKLQCMWGFTLASSGWWTLSEPRWFLPFGSQQSYCVLYQSNWNHLCCCASK